MGLLCFLTSSIVNAQSLVDQLDQIFESAYDPAKSGAAILITKEGKTIYQNQIGMANVSYQIPISTKTKFHIGSITKQFTAAAILILEEEGKLSTADPISKYMPNISDDKKAVTIAQLLSHTSGIKDYPRIPAIRKQIRNNLSPAQIIALVDKEALQFKPSTEMSYSNSGYILLGLIIEQVTGQDYATFLDQRIFKKLEMHSTSVNNYEAIVVNRAVGYSEDENDQLIHATFHTSPYASGAIISTGHDMSKWVTGLHEGKIINQKSLAKMFADNALLNGQTTGLGFGWEINQLADQPCFEHSGFVPGYKANSLYLPSQQIYVIVLQNNEYGSPTPTMITAAALVSGKPYPTAADAKQLSSAAIEDITGIYELANGEQRIIFKNETGLFIKSAGGQVSRLYAKDEHTVYYKEGYRQISFDTTNTGKIEGFVYRNRRLQSQATKIADDVPKEKKEVQLGVAILEKYVGSYQFEPFKVAITLTDRTLFIQPEGSNKLPLIATSASTFLVEEIGAELSFQSLPNNDMEAALLVEGDVMKGVRKKE